METEAVAYIYKDGKRTEEEAGASLGELRAAESCPNAYLVNRQTKMRHVKADFKLAAGAEYDWMVPAPAPTEITTPLDIATRIAIKLKRQPFDERLSHKLNALYPNLAVEALNFKTLEELVMNARKHLMSQTRESVMKSEVYSIDGLLFSTDKSSIYYLFKGTFVYCGKVMPTKLADEEWSISEKLYECPTLLKYIDRFQVNDQLIALVMPAYLRSAWDLKNAWFTSTKSEEEEDFVVELPQKIQEQAIVDIFASMLHTLEFLGRQSLCHSDIKPQNIMLTGRTAILIDLGAMIHYGKQIKEFTSTYCLDLAETEKHGPMIGSLSFDLICLATTITELSTGKVGAKKLVGFQARIQHNLKERHSIGVDLANLCLMPKVTLEFIQEKAKEFVNKAELSYPTFP